MATKLGRKELPSGLNPSDFKYNGRPANDQGDFGAAVGIVDMCCVNQFGDANNSKYYHAGVVQSADARWWVYLEWGRVKAGKSWNPSFQGQDFMFVQCSDESDARRFFASQCADKNTKRIQQKDIGGKTIWAAKEDKDGYLVQRLATRERGLPDAYTIKDATGVTVAPKPVVVVDPTVPVAPVKTFHPEVTRLAESLVGGTKDFARAASAATGIVPTLAAIEEVRNDCLPAALQLLSKIGGDVKAQLGNKQLQDLSKYVATVVPRPIPRSGDAMAILLTSDSILAIQQDLDAFESALKNEDFSVTPAAAVSATNPEKLLNADIRWIDPKSPEGVWLAASYMGMTNNRHSYISGKVKLKNMFAVSRPDRDAPFLKSVTKVANARKGNFSLKANLQPKRTDLGALGDEYAQANVILAIHGTRAVNVAPIMQGNLKLPRQLSGVVISGANFGHGIYMATDWGKSYGYTGHGNAYYGGGGTIRNRGFFMFLCDMIMGDTYRAPSTGSWTTPPNGKDSVFGVGGDRGHALQNDEHIIFDSSYQRIRYVIEGDL